jgi:hypothetical protein
MTSDVITNESGQEVAEIHYEQEPQYRMLEAGEIIQKGDKYEAWDNEWKSADKYEGVGINYDRHAKHRRPITPKNQ